MNFNVKDGKVYGTQKDGSIYYMFEDVTLNKIMQNVNNNGITAILRFKYGGMKVEVEVSRATYQTKKNLLTLQDKGLDVTEDNAKYMIEYLKKQEKSVKVKKSHNILGYDDENKCFRLYESYPRLSTYQGDLDIEPKGNYNKWLKSYEENVKGIPSLELAIVIGLSSAIIGMIGKDIGIENPIVHIYGDSSIGKTTAVQLALSCWGNPSLRANGLMQNYNETINSLMHNLRHNNGIPICFDEISMSATEDFTGFIYSTTNGKEKGRLASDGGKRYIKLDQATWNTVILSTGEYNILERARENDGLKVRVFSIGSTQWTKDAQNSDAIKNCVIHNYGHLGGEFVDNLLKLGKSKLIQIYNNMYIKVNEIFKKNNIFDQLTNRRVKYYTLLIMVSDIVNAKLNINVNKKEILSILKKIEKESISERNIGDQAYKKFLEVVSKNRRKFPVVPSKNNRGNAIKDDIWGYVLKKDNEVEVFMDEFKKQIRQLGFQSQSVIIKKWISQGRLNHEEDRNYRKRNNSNVYVINVDKEFIEGIEGIKREEKIEVNL